MYNTQISNHKSRNHMKVFQTVKAIYYAVSFVLFIGCSSNEIEEGTTQNVIVPEPIVQIPQGCPILQKCFPQNNHPHCLNLEPLGCRLSQT